MNYGFNVLYDEFIWSYTSCDNSLLMNFLQNGYFQKFEYVGSDTVNVHYKICDF